MIAKRILAPKGGAGYQRLGGYVLNVREKHRGDDPASWSRLNAYILDAEHEGEKVAWARVSNCVSDDPGWAVKEIIATQGRNTRSQRDKSYHLVVSFPEGERPTREQLEDIEDRLCEAIGFGEHQRVSAVHQNTDNWHLHIAINSVHPTSFRNVAPFQDHFRLQEACADLEMKHGLIRDNHAEPRKERNRSNGRAQDFEARTGGQSFLAWVRENAAPALTAAGDTGQGWAPLHEAASAHGLVLKLRGAGLVIGHASDSRLHVKASDVDRGLSLKALTDRLGTFEPAGSHAAPASGASYTKPGRTGDLYEAFKQERNVAERLRKSALDRLRTRHTTYARGLANFYQDRMQRERLSGLRGILRRASFQQIAKQQEQANTERRQREAAERKQARASHPIPNWQSWLEARAASGDLEALAMLRGRQQRAARLEADLLMATDPANIRHVIHEHLRPAVRRNGTVIYRILDGGLVADETTHVRVAQPTAAATLLALQLAAQRFGSKPLIVRGTDAFQEQVAALAGTQGEAVTFQDSKLESLRAAAKKMRESSVDRGNERA